jgi:surface polysaccharide O-acyltransferase-like enzyme
MDQILSEKIKVTSFLSILLVVFLHAYNVEPTGPFVAPDCKNFVWVIQDLFSNGFTRIAVPYFFLVSGYLYFYKYTGMQSAYVIQIKKRAKTLLLPYLFWSLLGIAFYYVLQTPLQLATYFSKELVVNYSLSQWLDKIFIHPIPYQFWFIRDLMLLAILSPVLYFACLRFKYIFILLCVALWCLPSEIWHNSSEALLFFTLGAVMGIFYKNTPSLSIPWSSNLMFWSWVFLVTIKTTASYLQYNPAIVQILLNASILLGVLFFWSALTHLEKVNSALKSTLIRLSGYTFFIYASHEPLLTIIKKISFKVLGNGPIQLLIVYFIAPVVVIGIATAIGILGKKYVGKAYLLITGGR